MKNPFGIKVKQSNLKGLSQALFYFMKEFHFNPLDEEYVLPDGRKIIKKGVTIPFFNAMMNEMEEHYKREQAQMKRKR